MPEAVSVILATYQAGPSLPQAVTAWEKALRATKRDHELIVVDDGSSPAPAHFTQRHATPLGIGACIRTGLGAAKHPLIVTATTHPEDSPDDLSALLARLESTENGTLDLVNGFRNRGVISPFRKGMGVWWRRLARIGIGLSIPEALGSPGPEVERQRRTMRWRFGVHVGDPSGTMRVVRKSILDRMELQSNGPFIHAEILAKANFLGALMDEVLRTGRRGGWAAPPEFVGAERWRQEMRVVFAKPTFHHPAIV